MPPLENLPEPSAMFKGTVNKARPCLTEREAHAVEIAAGQAVRERFLHSNLCFYDKFFIIA
ncbi:MAG: hypothetical protein IPK10_20100 [Bacteroidetes bacterium]|nr:hypothetical protein [Bacteroidota bacterium]